MLQHEQNNGIVDEHLAIILALHFWWILVEQTGNYKHSSRMLLTMNKLHCEKWNKADGIKVKLAKKTGCKRPWRKEHSGEKKKKKKRICNSVFWIFFYSSQVARSFMWSMMCKKGSDMYSKYWTHYHFEKVFNKAINLDMLQGKFIHLDWIVPVWESQDGVIAMS